MPMFFPSLEKKTCIRNYKRQYNDNGNRNTCEKNNCDDDNDGDDDSTRENN